MGWFTKLLKGSDHKILRGQYHGKYGEDRIWDNHHSSMVNKVFPFLVRIKSIATSHNYVIELAFYLNLALRLA